MVTACTCYPVYGISAVREHTYMHTNTCTRQCERCALDIEGRPPGTPAAEETEEG